MNVGGSIQPLWAGQIIWKPANLLDKKHPHGPDLVTPGMYGIGVSHFSFI